MTGTGRRPTTELSQTVRYQSSSPGMLMQALKHSSATDPSCPQGIVQWQHGTYTRNANGSLTLTPYGVDGRQLLSDPCNNANAVFTRYDQTELFKVQSTDWSPC